MTLDQPRREHSEPLPRDHPEDVLGAVDQGDLGDLALLA
jgi:hypothetical protein